MPKKKFDENVWSKIAETAIEEAENVDCPGPQFVLGLREIVDILRSRLESAQDEFGDADEEGDEGGDPEDDEEAGELDFDPDA
jgi:hypothetical protein